MVAVARIHFIVAAILLGAGCSKKAPESASSQASPSPERAAGNLTPPKKDPPKVERKYDELTKFNQYWVADKPVLHVDAPKYIKQATDRPVQSDFWLEHKGGTSVWKFENLPRPSKMQLTSREKKQDAVTVTQPLAPSGEPQAWNAPELRRSTIKFRREDNGTTLVVECEGPDPFVVGVAVGSYGPNKDNLFDIVQLFVQKRD